MVARDSRRLLQPQFYHYVLPSFYYLREWHSLLKRTTITKLERDREVFMTDEAMNQPWWKYILAKENQTCGQFGYQETKSMPLVKSKKSISKPKEKESSRGKMSSHQ